MRETRQEQQNRLDALRKSKPLSHWWLDTDCVPTFKSMKNCPTCGKPFVRVGWTWLHQDSPLHKAWVESEQVK